MTSVAMAFLRQGAQFETEVVSTSYYAEPLSLLQRRNSWVHVATSDGYRGWMHDSNLIEGLSFYPNPSSQEVVVSRLQGLVYGTRDTIFGPQWILPQGVRLEKIADLDERWIEVRLVDGKSAYMQRGDVMPEAPITDMAMLVQYAEKHYIGIPYVWGGRTSFGFDCSGFVQRLYEKMGIALARDAREQILDAHCVTVTEYMPGDLIFFGSSEEHITHVGIYAGEDRLLHATVQEQQPWVHISRLSDPLWNGRDRYRKVRRYELCGVSTR